MNIKLNNRSKKIVYLVLDVLVPAVLLGVAGVVALNVLDRGKTDENIFTYSIKDEQNKTAFINGFNGVINEKSSTTKLFLPSYIDGYSIVGIAKGTFYNLKYKEIKLPENLQTIEYEAFSACNFVEKISFPSTLKYVDKGALDSTKWYNNQNSKNIIYAGPVLYEVKSGYQGELSVKQGTLSIAPSAAKGSNITSLTLPTSLEYIGEESFSNTEKLYNITIPNKKIDIKEKAFYQSYIIEGQGGTFKMLGNHLYKVTPDLPTYTLPSNVINIADSVFKNNLNLTEVNFNNSLEYIGDSAFENCTNITSLNIPETVKSIGQSCFKGDSLLSNVSIKGVDTIEQNVFRDCNKLYSIQTSNDLHSIKSYAFANCESLNNITLGSNTEFIDDFAFQGCTKLSTIDFKLSSPIFHIESIMDTPFYIEQIKNVSNEKYINKVLIKANALGTIKKDTKYLFDRSFANLTNIDLDFQNSVKFVGRSTFKNSLINSFKNYNSLQEIGDFAFEGCTIKEFNINDSLKTLGNNIFLGVSGMVLKGNNTYFETENNVIYSKNFRRVLGSANNNEQSLYVKSSVFEITPYSFYKSNYENIYLPNYLKMISNNAFQNSKVKQLYFPKYGDSLKNIYSEAFKDCEQLNSVFLFTVYPSYLGADVFLNANSLLKIKMSSNIRYIYESDYSWSKYSSMFVNI